MFYTYILQNSSYHQNSKSRKCIGIRGQDRIKFQRRIHFCNHAKKAFEVILILSWVLISIGRTFQEDQRRYWTNRILREKGVLSPETIFKKIKPTSDTYQVWVFFAELAINLQENFLNFLLKFIDAQIASIMQYVTQDFIVMYPFKDSSRRKSRSLCQP